MSDWKWWLLRVALKIGSWEVKKQFPWLAPLIDEIICVLKGDPPSANLRNTADHYNARIAPK